MAKRRDGVALDRRRHDGGSQRLPSIESLQAPAPFSELRLQLTSPSTSPNESNTTLTPHSIIHGDACFAYFNKIWGIPVVVMPSLFTVAPNRRAGLPSPSDSAPQAAVSAPVERKKLQRTNAPHAFSGIFASWRPARRRYHSSFSCAASGAGAG